MTFGEQEVWDTIGRKSQFVGLYEGADHLLIHCFRVHWSRRHEKQRGRMTSRSICKSEIQKLRYFRFHWKPSTEPQQLTLF